MSAGSRDTLEERKRKFEELSTFPGLANGSWRTEDNGVLQSAITCFGEESPFLNRHSIYPFRLWALSNVHLSKNNQLPESEGKKERSKIQVQTMSCKDYCFTNSDFNFLRKCMPA